MTREVNPCIAAELRPAGQPDFKLETHSTSWRGLQPTTTRAVQIMTEKVKLWLRSTLEKLQPLVATGSGCGMVGIGISCAEFSNPYRKLFETSKVAQ